MLEIEAYKVTSCASRSNHGTRERSEAVLFYFKSATSAFGDLKCFARTPTLRFQIRVQPLLLRACMRPFGANTYSPSNTSANRIFRGKSSTSDTSINLL